MGLTKKRREMLQKKIEDDFGYRRYHDRDIEVIDRGGSKGCGVFAARQFLPGELILEVRGQLLNQKDYEGSTYVMEFDDKWYLEPGVPACYVNHSCSPNTELMKITKFTMGFVAFCNIEAGTEITFDYQWEAADWIPRCNCGAPNCRGWVVGETEVKKMEKLTGKRKPGKKNKDESGK
ncbi:SET domain protein [Crateriforma conspicua]|uniref:SET domain protein n=2 Tax=Crateriforma conspicua TaxID=2527996 RepID=A0A5C5Y884_9PLAN|nr:SET domain protein [Crateriforma conspicua]TWT71876.1 SET domain protein [Crateriforma conspicua]